MEVTLRIQRFNPENDKKPWWGEYKLSEVDPTSQVLDLLHRVKWEQDGTLSLRRSCAHGICGSDAMLINGVNRLACKILVRDLVKGESGVIAVAPIIGLPVVKDLVVDMEPFFDHYRAVMPYFVNDEEAGDRERYQSQEDRALFDDTTKCILCAACTTSCPSFWSRGEYVGPAAIVQAHRFIFDDLQLHQRLPTRDRSDTCHWRGEERHRQGAYLAHNTRLEFVLLCQILRPNSDLRGSSSWTTTCCCVSCWKLS
jgi:succinate dehydrogenase / fumarate reductase iron-sulfur subunit